MKIPEEDLIQDWKHRLVFWSGAIGVGRVAVLDTVG